MTMIDHAEVTRYQDAVERIKDAYEDRVMRVLGDIGDRFRSLGWDVAGPYDMSCDDFTWNLALRPDDIEEHLIDVSIEIAESLGYEGSVDGVNLGLRIVRWGGSVLGVLEPFNYTPQVWVDVDDAAAIARRFEYVLADHVPAEAVSYILANA